MYDIQTFNSPIFGSLRTVIIKGKEYFYGMDIATDLMYKRPRKAIIDHCKGVLSQDGSVLSQDAEPIIPEGDVYRLIIKAGQQGNSKEIKQKADELEKWIFDDILPTLRKKGSYGVPQTIPEQIQLLAQGNVELNKRVDDIQAEVKHLKLDLPILPIEAEKITNATRAKGVSVMGGKGSNAYANRSIVNAVYKDIYGQIYRNFGVSTYKAIKRSQTDKVITVIEEYKPPVVLQDRIDSENAQQSLNLEGGACK